eukprot:7360260-Prymnesium_polylepis.1
MASAERARDSSAPTVFIPERSTRKPAAAPLDLLRHLSCAACGVRGGRRTLAATARSCLERRLGTARGQWPRAV